MNHDNDGVRPARPQLVTEAARPLREVRSFARRGSRLSPKRAAAWEAHRAAWVIDEAELSDEPPQWGRWFGREAPLIIEIGPGIAEATVALAAGMPDHNVLALEVWRPGIADGLGRLATAGVDNVRFCAVDAAWLLQRLIVPDSLAGLWTFFPDPWPKARHHKRRLINSGFAHMAATRLRPGATWRLATDWADYADQMREVLDGEPLLTGGVVPRWNLRPVTKFERRGIAAGRAITDFAYLRSTEE